MIERVNESDTGSNTFMNLLKLVYIAGWLLVGKPERDPSKQLPWQYVVGELVYIAALSRVLTCLATALSSV